jgi:hypothetical protein
LGEKRGKAWQAGSWELQDVDEGCIVADDVTSLLHSLRDAIANDATTKVWTQAQYSADHHVYVGVDQKNPPAPSNYPAVGLFPVRSKQGYALTAKTREFTAACAIEDETMLTTGIDNATEYNGLPNLTTFCALIQDAIVTVSLDAGGWINVSDIEYGVLSVFPTFGGTIDITIDIDYFQGGEVFS